MNITPVYYNWDVNRIYAVSNSSNSGRDILTAMYNGTDIVYKVSPNAMVYKGGTTGIIPGGKVGEVKLYPNPASEHLYVTGAEGAEYEVTDMAGKKVLTGKNPSAIDIQALQAGFYILRLGNEKTTKAFKFSKQ